MVEYLDEGARLGVGSCRRGKLLYIRSTRYVSADGGSASSWSHQWTSADLITHVIRHDTATEPNAQGWVRPAYTSVVLRRDLIEPGTPSVLDFDCDDAEHARFMCAYEEAMS